MRYRIRIGCPGGFFTLYDTSWSKCLRPSARPKFYVQEKAKSYTNLVEAELASGAQFNTVLDSGETIAGRTFSCGYGSEAASVAGVAPSLGLACRGNRSVISSHSLAYRGRSKQ